MEDVKAFIDAIEATEPSEVLRKLALDAKEGRMKWGEHNQDWGARDLSGG